MVININKKYYSGCYLSMLLFFLFPICIAQAENQQKENIRELPEAKALLNDVNEAFKFITRGHENDYDEG